MAILGHACDVCGKVLTGAELTADTPTLRMTGLIGPDYITLDFCAEHFEAMREHVREMAKTTKASGAS
jgi:hypothetical protein